MCDPLTIAGIALTGASAAANSAASSQVAKARTTALREERARQKGYDQQGDTINAHAQDQFSGFQDKQAARAQTLGDFFTGQDAAPPTADRAIPMPSSNLVVDEQAKQAGKAQAFTDKVGTALGNLRSFGDVMGTDSRATARDASSLGQLYGFKQGSNAVLPFELDAASQAGNGMKMFGDVLGGLGSLATLGGLTGAFGAAKAGASAGAAAGTATAAPRSLVSGLMPTPRLGMLY